MQIHETLPALLEQRNWKAVHLVAALSDAGYDVSITSVQNWLDGRFTPRVDIARAIADALGISLDDLCPSPTAVPAE